MLKVREIQRCDLEEDVMFILDSLISQVSLKSGVYSLKNWVSFTVVIGFSKISNILNTVYKIP